MITMPSRWVGVLGIVLGALGIGAVVALVDSRDAARPIWAATAILAALPTGVAAVRTLHTGRVGVDVIALIAIATALVLGEYLAAAIIGLMLVGGTALEDRAARHARSDLAGLVARMPVIARVRDAQGIREVPVGSVNPGDLVVVPTGEIVPVDGHVSSEEAILDESALTGEPLPVVHPHGEPVRSGTSNAGQAFDLRATRRADDSA